jgi:putative nucleotidyltransferase with HDIG domain
MKKLNNLTNLNKLKVYLSQLLQQLPVKVSPATARKLKTTTLKCKAYQSLIFLVTVASFTSLVGYRFYNQPRLAQDTVSPVKILAPYDGTFIDTKTTEEKRRKIRNGIIPVLKLDEPTNIRIKDKISHYLQEIEDVRLLISNFKVLEIDFLTIELQRELLQCNDWEFQSIINNKNNLLNKQELEQARLKIATYRQQISDTQFSSFKEAIGLLRREYLLFLEKITQEIIPILNEQDLNILARINYRDWGNLRDRITKTTDKIVTQGIPEGLPPSIKQKAIERQLEDIKEPEIKGIATKIMVQVLQANLIIDEEETKHRAERVAEAMEPVTVTVRKGEVIVDTGKKITREEFALLDGFNLSRRGVNWLGLGFSALLVIGAVIIFIFVAIREHRSLRRRDLILIFFLSLSPLLLVIFDINYTSLPAVALLVSTFYSPSLAITQIALLSGLVGFATGGSGWEYLLAETAGGMVAAAVAGRLHSREDLAFLGATIGLTQGSVYLIINLILSASAKAVLYVVLPGGILYGLSGVAWVVVALGISPYLERFFDLVTPIRLAELSNPNRPLLKKLAIEAPGTFQHTMFVASLAEAAARALHCNVELVRAGTLYHDIGKLHDPLGFIENQMGGSNKHDQINDPRESAAIIKKHVSEGLIMARQYGLPRAIRDFIPEHQGTLLISYFYFQARQKAQGNAQEVLEKDFQYDGPIPQSRETGIVMLADACEAALRSLKDVTPEEALVTVKKIFMARWRDQQLAESGLKYEELPIIAEVFIRVWQQYNHQRIAYPKVVLS